MRAPTLLHRIVATAALGVLSVSGISAGIQATDAPLNVAVSDTITEAAVGEIVEAPEPSTSPASEATSERATTAPPATDEAAEEDADREAREREAAERQERQARERRRITALQERLAALGWYRGSVDGIAGPATEQAVRDFQRASGLTADGVAGDRTMTALKAKGAITRAEWQAQQPKPTSSPSPSSGSSSTSSSSGSSSTGSSSGSSSSSCDLECRRQRVLGRSPLKPPSGWTVTFKPGRDGYLGMAYGAPRREIIVWVRSSHSDNQVGATLLHEIGHAYDFEGLGGNGDAGRERWAKLRGFGWSGRDDWFGNGCSSCTDFGIGAGDLAESVHACWAPGWDSFRSQMAGKPTSSQCSVLRDLIS